MVSKHSKLAAWTVANKQTRKSVNGLLRILREDDPSLPLDYRSLCRTPKISSTQIIDMNNEKYIHFGPPECLKEFLVHHDVKQDFMQIDINIDGVPVANSSNSCLWPILVNVVGFRPVLLIGVYFGSEKPVDINVLMERFVADYLSICENNIISNQKMYSLQVRCVVADAPARALFLNIKAYSIE